MGYGGDLLIAASIVEYRKHTNYKVALVLRPGIFELASGKLYRPIQRDAIPLVLKDNPDIVFITSDKEPKGIHKKLNTLFDRMVKKLKLERAYSNFLQVLCRKYAKKTGLRYFYKDDDRFSYAAVSLHNRMLWKDKPNAVAAILEGFAESERPAITHPQPAATLHGLLEYAEEIKAIMQKHQLEPGKFVVFEPGTNTEWFGELRAWDLHYWQALIPQLKAKYPEIKFVRLGVDQQHEIKDSVDLRRQTSFLGAIALMKQSKLFIGTEGGLMHGARAVNTQSVIIWGGVTTPSFAGYPDAHRIVTTTVACAPCGLLGNCPNAKACLNGIDVESVYQVCSKSIDAYTPGVTELPALPVKNLVIPGLENLATSGAHSLLPRA